MKITWLTDDTIRVEAVFKDFDGTLFTPDSHSIIFTDSAGSARGTVTAPTLVGTGTARTDYITPAAGPKGVWKVSWKALSGSYPVREIGYFTVAEG